MNTAKIQVNIDPIVKKKADHILKQLNITTSEAVRAFYSQIILRKGIPFAIVLPDKKNKYVKRKNKFLIK